MEVINVNPCNGASDEYIKDYKHIIGCEVVFGTGDNRKVAHVLRVDLNASRIGLLITSLPFEGDWSTGFIYLDRVMFINEFNGLLTYTQYMNVYYPQHTGA